MESEPDFQYIPEKSPTNPSQLDQDAWRDSMLQLQEGLHSGTILAHFDVSHEFTWIIGLVFRFSQSAVLRHELMTILEPKFIRFSEVRNGRPVGICVKYEYHDFKRNV